MLTAWQPQSCRQLVSLICRAVQWHQARLVALTAGIKCPMPLAIRSSSMAVCKETQNKMEMLRVDGWTLKESLGYTTRFEGASRIHPGRLGIFPNATKPANDRITKRSTLQIHLRGLAATWNKLLGRRELSLCSIGGPVGRTALTPIHDH